MALVLIRKEHDAELAHNGVAACIRERQSGSISGLELDRFVPSELLAATSSIGGLRSVAIKRASCGSRSRKRRVTRSPANVMEATQVFEELAQADASVAWCVRNSDTHWTAAIRQCFFGKVRYNSLRSNQAVVEDFSHQIKAFCGTNS